MCELGRNPGSLKSGAIGAELLIGAILATTYWVLLKEGGKGLGGGGQLSPPLGIVSPTIILSSSWLTCTEGGCLASTYFRVDMRITLILGSSSHIFMARIADKIMRLIWPSAFDIW